MIVFPTAKFMKVWIKCVWEKVLSKSLEGTFCHFVWISAARKLSPQHWFFNFNSKVAPWVAVCRIILQYNISTFTQNLIVKWLERRFASDIFPILKVSCWQDKSKLKSFSQKPLLGKLKCVVSLPSHVLLIFLQNNHSVTFTPVTRSGVWNNSLELSIMMMMLLMLVLSYRLTPG